ncbi:MAG: translation initiation factor [Paramuribaculum sp.]|nr:translation initiation factor [Paramuribaculum sp.]
MNWLEQLQQFRDNNPELPEGPQTPEPQQEKPRQKARIDVSIERKGRAGKTATLLTGWELPDQQLLEIAAELKKKLGTGGSARGGDILIQGDRRDEVVGLLGSMGYKARKI